MLDRRLLIVSGKGGVGKSAVTAALARLAAGGGRSVLAVAMTDGVGLASHLGIDHIGHTATTVHGGLQAMAVNRSRALDDYLRTQMRLPKGAPLAQFTRLFRVLVETVPGVREIISMGKPIQDVWTRAHDLVIVDAPPLGQMFSYLSAPATISRLVPSGAVRDQAGRMSTTLADPAQSGLVLVSTLDELPVVETAEAISRLAASPVIDLAAIVANRVLAELPVSPEIVDGLPDGPVADAARMHTRLVESQQRWAEELGPARRIPFLFGSIRATDVVDEIVAGWETP